MARSGIGYLRRNALIWVYGGALLQASNLVLGLAATLLTLSVAVRPFPTWNYPILGFIAAALTATVTFVKAEKRGQAWSAAGRELEDMIARYDSDTTYTLNDVIKAGKRQQRLQSGLTDPRDDIQHSFRGPSLQMRSFRSTRR